MPSLQTTATVTTTHVIKLKPSVRARVLTDLRTYGALKRQRDALDLAMTRHRTNVEQVLSEIGEEKLELDGYKATLVAPVRKKFDPKKFVKLGGNLDTYTKALLETPGKSYVKVTLPGDTEEGE